MAHTLGHFSENWPCGTFVKKLISVKSLDSYELNFLTKVKCPTAKYIHIDYLRCGYESNIKQDNISEIFTILCQTKPLS